MRIIAGRLGGHTFASPHSFKTHPMSDKIRGALFNILGDIKGLTVLDPFAGSGALSLEAASRGASKAVAIDNDRAAQRVIAENIKRLGVEEQVRLITASANAWLQTNPDVQFDIVVCDPPYNDLQISLVQRLLRCVGPQGVFVLSWPGDVSLPDFDGYKKVAHRNYGDAQLAFFTP
jgi:16S rRNA (guanine966-N2)-methyltransferase